jgi:hypothetical protein
MCGTYVTSQSPMVYNINTIIMKGNENEMIGRFDAHYCRLLMNLMQYTPITEKSVITHSNRWGGGNLFVHTVRHRRTYNICSKSSQLQTTQHIITDQ